jgi:hypothetical protein
MEVDSKAKWLALRPRSSSNHGVETGSGRVVVCQYATTTSLGLGQRKSSNQVSSRVGPSTSLLNQFVNDCRREPQETDSAYSWFDTD